MFPRKLLLSLFLLPLLAAPVQADFSGALRAYDNGDYQTALAEFRSLATGGDADAQSILALMYLEGQAVDTDMGQAIGWYVAAAEQGQVDAQYALSIIAMEGVGGTSRDETTAALWMREAARRGHMYAQFDLGNMYANGFGVERSDPEAARWFEAAAELGHKDAQYNLGIMYLTPRGVEQDRERAFQWFRRAAEQGHRDAQYNLGVSYLTGRAVPRDIELAVRWLEAAAVQGQSSAVVALGLLSLEGADGIEQNRAEAARLFRQAANAGNPEGQYFLAVLYTRGLGVEQDPVEAYAWLEIAGSRISNNPELAQSLDALRQSLTAVMTASEIAEADVVARERGQRFAVN